MGRGGGSHGGGGHSGGRSFGGRSGGAGRSPGNFGRPTGPGFGGPPPGGPGFGGPRRWSGPVYHGPRRWGGPTPPVGGWRRPGRGGCGCSAVILVLIVLLFFFVNAAQNQQETSSVAVSRTERTAITGTETYGEWYQDDLGYIDHDTDLTDGLKYFYSQTGIQPYVMLLDYDPDMWKNGKWNESVAETCLAGIYNDTFSDNGHLIFAYFACENDSEDMNGTFYFYYGSAAYSIMDDEAEDIFWSYFDMNYNDLDQSIAEFIGKTFEETADNIMHNSKNSDISLIEIIPVFLAVSVVVIVICVVVIWNMKKKEL